MEAFSHIGIFTKPNDVRVDAALRLLYPYLRGRGLQVWCDHTAGVVLDLPPLPSEELARRIDLALVVGGDGTLLAAGRLLAAHGVPLVGVNLGRLGFLADVSPATMLAQLDAILDGKHCEEQRLLLQAVVERDDGEPLGSGLAFNDVVLRVRNEIRLLEFSTWIDGKFVNTQRADGIIIATPTGSTAYALSSGGPIMHPALEAIALVPICPHTLSDRPLVLGSGSTVELQLQPQRDAAARVSFDGHHNVLVEAGDRVRVHAHPHKVRLLHPPDYDYYRILRSKLHWGVQP